MPGAPDGTGHDAGADAFAESHDHAQAPFRKLAHQRESAADVAELAEHLGGEGMRLVAVLREHHLLDHGSMAAAQSGDSLTVGLVAGGSQVGRLYELVGDASESRNHHNGRL